MNHRMLKLASSLVVMVFFFTFSPTSTAVASATFMPKGGTFTFSVGTGPDGIAIGGSGNVWVTNFGSSSVTKLSSSGATLGTFSVGSHPEGIAIDGSGNVWVVNSGSSSVNMLTGEASPPQFFPYVGPQWPWGI